VTILDGLSVPSSETEVRNRMKKTEKHTYFSVKDCNFTARSGI
jgi:hypothetical protein